MIFTEAEPLGPQVAGDTGGDYQVSEAYDRRWTAKLADGSHAVVDVAFYLDSMGDGDKLPKLVRQTEYIQCTDPADPGGTEMWSDYVYDTLAGDSPTEADAREKCARVTAYEIACWTNTVSFPGRQFYVRRDEKES
jgi:hypothetical protein